MNRMKRRIHDWEGFTLAETLIVLLIVLLVSSVVAAGMPAAKDAYYKVIETADAQLYLSTTLQELRNELSTASEIEVDESGNSVKYINPVTGEATISLKTASDGRNYLGLTAYKDYNGVDYPTNPTDPINQTTDRPLISNADKAKDKQTLSVRMKSGKKLFKYENGILTVGAFEVISTLTGGNAVASLPDEGYSIRVLVPGSTT